MTTMASRAVENEGAAVKAWQQQLPLTRAQEREGEIPNLSRQANENSLTTRVRIHSSSDHSAILDGKIMSVVDCGSSGDHNNSSQNSATMRHKISVGGTVNPISNCQRLS